MFRHYHAATRKSRRSSISHAFRNAPVAVRASALLLRETGHLATGALRNWGPARRRAELPRSWCQGLVQSGPVSRRTLMPDVEILDVGCGCQMWMFRCQIVPAQWDAVGRRVSRRNVNIPIRQCTTIYPTMRPSEMRHGDTGLSLARRPCPSRLHPTPTSQPPFQTPAGRVLLHKPIQIQSIEQRKSHAHPPLAFLSSARNALKPLVLVESHSSNRVCSSSLSCTPTSSCRSAAISVRFPCPGRPVGPGFCY